MKSSVIILFISLLISGCNKRQTEKAKSEIFKETNLSIMNTENNPIPAKLYTIPSVK